MRRMHDRFLKTFQLAGIACLLTLFVAGKGMAQSGLIFSDNFQSGLNTSQWDIIQRAGNGSGAANAEAQYYIHDGVQTDSRGLHLAARRAVFADPKTGMPFAFTSGRIESVPTFLYGRFEFRAKLPAGRGLWPAMWLRTPEKLPFNGEIDVVEGLGSHPHAIQSTVHLWQNGQHVELQSAQMGLTSRRGAEDVTGAIGSPPDFSAGYHTFAMEWRSDHVTWYLDRRQYYTTTQDVPQVPMRIVINLAVGGSFDGPPTAQTHFPVWLDVASVKVYR